MKGLEEIEENVEAKNGSKHIGTNVRRTREIRGLLQFQLADMLGIKPSTLSEIESSKKLKKPTLLKIADALKVSPEFIEDFNDEAFNNSITNIYNAENISGISSKGDVNYNSDKEAFEFLRGTGIYFRDLSLKLQAELSQRK